MFFYTSCSYSNQRIWFSAETFLANHAPFFLAAQRSSSERVSGWFAPWAKRIKRWLSLIWLRLPESWWAMCWKKCSSGTSFFSNRAALSPRLWSNNSFSAARLAENHWLPARQIWRLGRMRSAIFRLRVRIFPGRLRCHAVSAWGALKRVR